jgi:hypothetical protein
MPLRRNPRVPGLAGIASLVVALFLANAPTVAAQTSVTTYHNDNYRTGWNPNETVLNPANVTASQFGLLAMVAVDDQVDAQPLLVTGVTITAGNYQGQHDVVYVVTGNNTVYAIDANTGTVLLSNHLGLPVNNPLGCTNNGPRVGITSTPVIDTGSNTMYLIAYTQDSTGPAYRLHAMDLGSLTDKMTPAIVSASHTLTDGTSFVFNATYQRQRPSLLEANGNIYAGSAVSAISRRISLAAGCWVGPPPRWPRSRPTRSSIRRPLLRIVSFCRQFGCRATGWPPTTPATLFS